MPKKRPGKQPATRKKTHRKNTRKRPAATSLALSHGPPADPGQPPWAPSLAESAAVPEAVRQPLQDLILPIYQRSVLQATDPLEQSLSATLTHLLWLEVLEQYNLKQQYTNFESLLDVEAPRHDEIDHQLRLLETKARVGHLMVRLRELHAQELARQTLPAPPVLEAIAHSGEPNAGTPEDAILNPQ